MKAYRFVAPDTVLYPKRDLFFAYSNPFAALLDTTDTSGLLYVLDFQDDVTERFQGIITAKKQSVLVAKQADPLLQRWMLRTALTVLNTHKIDNGYEELLRELLEESDRVLCGEERQTLNRLWGNPTLNTITMNRAMHLICTALHTIRGDSPRTIMSSARACAVYLINLPAGAEECGKDLTQACDSLI